MSETVTPKSDPKPVEKATKTISLKVEVPVGEDPEAYQAKADKALKRYEKDSKHRGLYNDARHAAMNALIANHRSEYLGLLKTENTKRGIKS